MASCGVQELGHSFPQYGLPGWEITYIYFIQTPVVSRFAYVGCEESESSLPGNSGAWYFNISVYRRLIAGWFWWFGGINFVVKFGELSVHRVSLLSLESTQKKKSLIKMNTRFLFFSLFGLTPHVTEFLSAKSLALAKIDIQMPYLDNNVFHNLTLFRVSHVHNSIQSACKRTTICLFICCISHVYQSPSS